jgi:hypothetical protein
MSARRDDRSAGPLRSAPGGTMPMMASDIRRGDVGVSVVPGRAARQADEVALGQTTLEPLGMDLGDRIDWQVVVGRWSSESSAPCCSPKGPSAMTTALRSPLVAPHASSEMCGTAPKSTRSTSSAPRASTGGGRRRGRRRRHPVAHVRRRPRTGDGHQSGRGRVNSPLAGRLRRRPVDGDARPRGGRVDAPERASWARCRPSASSHGELQRGGSE